MNNLSVIPFYSTKEEQDHRKWYAYGDIFPLTIPGAYLVPFFFVLPLSARTISKVEIYQICDCGDTLIDDITSDMVSNGLSISHDDEDTIVYLANHSASLGVPQGMMYLKFTFSDSLTMYSDVFKVGDVSSLVKLEWSCDENLSTIPYDENFSNILYLDTTIAYPTYETSEEGEERDGYFFATKQLSWKRYNMSFIAPEYLCDALRLVFMSDFVSVNDTPCDTFNINVEWLEGGHYANVVCAFQTDTVVKKIGKSYNNL